MNMFLLFLLLALDYTGKPLLEGMIKLIPMIMIATITTVMKLIIESKKNKITFLGGVMTWAFAMGISYIFYPIVVDYIKDSWQGVVIGAIVLTGEKIVTWIMYTLRVEDFLAYMGDYTIRKLKKIFTNE